MIYVTRRHVVPILNALMESALVCPNFKVTLTLGVDRSAYRAQNVIVIKLASVTNARIHVPEHVHRMQFAMSLIIYRCAAVQRGRPVTRLWNVDQFWVCKILPFLFTFNRLIETAVYNHNFSLQKLL